MLDVKEEIRYSGRKTEKLIEILLKKAEYGFLKKESFVSEEDRRDYCEFLENLGKSDVFGQMHYCELAIKRTEAKLRAASEKYETTGKVYCTLGFCAGLAISLIIV